MADRHPIYVTHSQDGLACSDWSLDQLYANLVTGAKSGPIHYVTSSMVVVTRLRVGVVQDGIELHICFNDRPDYAKVNEDGTLDDWTGSLDVHIDMLMTILREGKT